MEIAKLDKYNLQAGPLKRISKDSMNSLALNPVEDCYSVAIGFESGSIELLTEQSSNSIVLHGYTHDPVLSLAFSAQVRIYAAIYISFNGPNLVFMLLNVLESSAICWSP